MREYSRRDIILASINDLVVNFTYYDRKEDEDLSYEDLQAAIEEGEITIDEIVEKFRKQLVKELG